MFCDGCGEHMTKPLVMHSKGDRTYNFDSFECYERTRGTLGIGPTDEEKSLLGQAVTRGVV